MNHELSERSAESVLRMDHFVEKIQILNMPVLVNGDSTVSSINLSELPDMPLVVAISRIYADGSMYEQVMSCLSDQGHRSKPNAGIGG